MSEPSGIAPVGRNGWDEFQEMLSQSKLVIDTCDHVLAALPTDS